jgi:hypothetical protein
VFFLKTSGFVAAPSNCISEAKLVKRGYVEWLKSDPFLIGTKLRCACTVRSEVKHGGEFG